MFLLLLFFSFGLGCLILGGEILFRRAARSVAPGISPMVIGLTVVAFGTSSPELAVSLKAQALRSPHVARANEVGSRILTLLLALGLSRAVWSLGMPLEPNTPRADVPVRTAQFVARLPIFPIVEVLDRWEGGLFPFCYSAYTACLVLRGGNHVRLPSCRGAIVGSVFPVLDVFLVISSSSSRRCSRRVWYLREPRRRICVHDLQIPERSVWEAKVLA
jgi:cation:H+ antiporter